MGLPGMTNEKRANRPMNRKIIKGLDRIGQGDKKGRNEVVQVSSPRTRRRAKRLHRITAEGIDTKSQQHDAAHYLKKNMMLQDEFVHETHSVSRNQRIANIT